MYKHHLSKYNNKLKQNLLWSKYKKLAAIQNKIPGAHNYKQFILSLVWECYYIESYCLTHKKSKVVEMFQYYKFYPRYHVLLHNLSFSFAAVCVQRCKV